LNEMAFLMRNVLRAACALRNVFGRRGRTDGDLIV
jgi:hypothetical protein